MSNVESPMPGLVSINMPMFNTPEAFLLDAVASIRRQTYGSWELILIDDGSEPPVSDLARRIAADDSDRIRYLEHGQHRNLGISASRNLGLSASRGEYIAFLDADDVWDEQQLLEQLSLLEEHAQAQMVFGNTLYWSSWKSGKDIEDADVVYDLRLNPGIISPPDLLRKYLQGQAISPCMTSVVVRRRVIDSGICFEEAFTGHYEDQVFLAKVWASHPVYVSDRVWGKYRQHAGSVTADIDAGRTARYWRRKYLTWLSKYLAAIGAFGDDFERAIRLQLWLTRFPQLDRIRRIGEKLRKSFSERLQTPGKGPDIP